jgi:methylamine dehydrogenase heavy chain
MLRFAAALAIAALSSALPAFADVAAEETGGVAETPAEWSPHSVWVGDVVLRRAALFDADSAAMLGSIYGGQDLSPPLPLTSRARREVYLASTFYSRRTRGERTDALTIYDAATLAPKAEVVLPPKKADNGNGVALSALLDDGRFVVVFNQTPANSVSVVDVVERRFVAEIATGGCALVYPAGPRRFGMLCVDGSALAVTLDERGAEASRAASEKFFDAATDPVTEKGVRLASGTGRWLFASFEGMAHEVDFSSGPQPVAKAAWSLFTPDEREDGWRIGGLQHLAFHAPSNRLYSLVHQGEADSHKESGSELWVYDFASRARTQTIAVPNLMAIYLRGLLKLPAGGALDWLLQHALPNLGAESVLVTPDADPLLLLAQREAAAVAVLRARDGEPLRDIPETGIGMGNLVVP